MQPGHRGFDTHGAARSIAASSIAALLALALTTACGNRDTQNAAQRDAATGDAAEAAEEGPCPTVPAGDREKVVAKVGDVEITVCEVTEALNKMSPYLRKAYEAPQKRQQFLDNMIRFELIAQEAERRGYASDVEVQRVRKQMMIQRLNKQLQDSVRLSDITEEEMQAYYESHSADYHKAENVRIARILLGSKAEAEKILALAKAKANDSRYFRQLAREQSTDEQTKEHGGDLPYFPRPAERVEGDPEIDPALAEAAFSLDMREPLYDKVVKTADGWNVIRLRGRRKARDLSFEDVKRQIRHRLHRDKLREVRDELVAKLRKSAKIDIDEAELARVQIQMPAEGEGGEGMPPMPPGAMPPPPGAEKAMPGVPPGPGVGGGKAPPPPGKGPGKGLGKAPGPAKAPAEHPPAPPPPPAEG